jgi:pimeloyl-ACP methyl ester carboxylesterase
MRTKACTDFHGTQLVDGAGHWAQQEQPEAVSGRLIDFLKSQPS